MDQILAKSKKISIFWGVVFLFFSFTTLSFAAGMVFNHLYPDVLKSVSEKLKISLPGISPEPTKVIEKEVVKEYLPQTSQEEAIIKVVKEVSPAVVSIIITKDLPVLEQYYISPFEEFFGEPFFEFKIPQYRQKGTQKQEIGGGTGFIV